MTSVSVQTKVENTTDETGKYLQKIMKTFPLNELPFTLTKEVEGTFSLDKSKIKLPLWANFSEKEYEYTVKLTDKLLCIYATTPELVTKAAGKIFHKFVDEDTYLTRKNLGETFTFRKRKDKEEKCSFNISAGSLFPDDDEDY